MNKMSICVWFDRGKAREAAEFYASVFPDSRVGEGHASAAVNPSAKEGEEPPFKKDLVQQILVPFPIESSLSVTAWSAVKGRSSGPIASPRQRMTARSMTLESSRTLPGHG